ncbi:hypothetical protein [Streptomyces sp. NPDC059398]|uniref:hypothetical protein n=1 Tax=Streptomyces sp. NPDC059398 TaxID=3346820 RepID=UPI0036C3EDCE
MSVFEFELEPVRNDRGHGYRGQVGKFGDVDVFRDVRPLRHESRRQAALHGLQFPDTLFSGGAGNIPSLDGGWLRVDGDIVDLNLKINGLRRGGRWLEMKHRQHIYEYMIMKKEAHLRRGEDVAIAMRRGSYVPNVGGTRIGRVNGDANATDLAIAIIMETVDTSALSTLDALLAAPVNFLFRRRQDGGSEW